MAIYKSFRTTIPSISLILTGLGVIFLNEIISHLLTNLYSKFTFIRRLLLGNQFVEGTWVEFISLNDSIHSVGVITIESCGLELQIHGYNYSLDGHLRYDFTSQSEMVKMEWPVFRYAYEKRPFQGSEIAVKGVAHIKFGPTGAKPTMYTGAFSHIGAGLLHGIEARIIHDKIDNKNIRDASKVRAILQKYIEQRSNEITSKA